MSQVTAVIYRRNKKPLLLRGAVLLLVTRTSLLGATGMTTSSILNDIKLLLVYRCSAPKHSLETLFIGANQAQPGSVQSDRRWPTWWPKASHAARVLRREGPTQE